MHHRFVAIAAPLIALFAGVAAAQPADDRTRVGFPQHPALSPDASTLVFSWAGDLWAADIGGGAATRLTAHPADEHRAAFSPDGTHLAFDSRRHGAMNLYIASVSGSGAGTIAGPARRVTVSDSSQTLAGFLPDGSGLAFDSMQRPGAFNHRRMFKAPLDGGPTTLISEAFGNLPMPAANGDILFSRGYTRFIRPAYRGSAAPDVFRLRADGTVEQLTTFDGYDAEPHQRPDGTVLFISARDGQNNLWSIAPDGTLTQRTRFQPSRPGDTIAHGVRDLTVSADGSTAAFCVWDTVYTLDLDDPRAAPVSLVLRGTDDADRTDIDQIDARTMVSEAALSPDQQTIAVVARGEIFVRNVDDDHPTQRVTNTSARESGVAWSPDGRVLYFVTDQHGQDDVYQASVTLTRDDLEPEDPEETEDSTTDDEAPADDGDSEDGDPEDNGDDEDEGEGDDGESEDDADESSETPDHGARWAQALRFEIEPVVATDAREHSPLPSPDGRSLLFIRNTGDLILHDLASGSERTIFESWDEPSVLWAHDARHIVYAIADLDFNVDIWLLDTADAEAEAINLTRHPDIDVSPRLSADGKTLLFRSDRARENGEFDAYRVHLDRALDGMTDFEMEAHVSAGAKAASKTKPIKTDANGVPTDDAPDPFEFDADDAYRRSTKITSIDGTVTALALTPGADRVVMGLRSNGDTTLVSTDHTGENRKTITSGRVTDVAVGLTGTKISLVKGGQAHTAPVKGGDVDTLSVRAPITVNVEEQQAQKFVEAARTLGDAFYHPTLKGLDWTLLTERYLELAKKTRTSAAFNRVGNFLFGELNGSHLGVRGGPGFSTTGPRVGHLGILSTPTPQGHRVDRVLQDGPAQDILQPGDVITLVNDAPVALDGNARDLDAALAGTSGAETLLTIDRPEEGTIHRLITPTSSAGFRTLMYKHVIEARRARVDERSGGRLGYLHIRGMGLAQVKVFEQDLYAAAHGKDGLLIDVRDNGGGWTTDILLASLTAPAHAYTVPRGADAGEAARMGAYPRDRRLIYGYTRPITVLMNQNSFSNAEIFSHAIKTTGRGTLVGTTTHGGVISTGSHRLIDGTTIRMPFRGWYLPDGTDMELNGAEPDVPVDRTPQDEIAGRDRQLEVAVDELLGRLD